MRPAWKCRGGTLLNSMTRPYTKAHARGRVVDSHEGKESREAAEGVLSGSSCWSAAVAAVWWWRVGRGPEVTAVAPWRGTAVEIVYATGAVEPVRWAKVTSLIRGRIIELCDCEGKQVAKGDVLARLDDREQRAQLQELKAREDFAKRELARVTELIGRGSATTQAHERSSTDLRTIQALISVQMEKLDNYTITCARWTAWCCAATARSARSSRPARSCSASACPSRCRWWPRSTRRTSRA